MQIIVSLRRVVPAIAAITMMSARTADPSGQLIKRRFPWSIER